jgi:hypothetical protein
MLANYHLKGSAPDVARELGLTTLKAGGSIIGKRCGWTQNLGSSAIPKKSDSREVCGSP